MIRKPNSIIVLYYLFKIIPSSSSIACLSASLGVGCSRFSDSGEHAKVKSTQRVGGVEKEEKESFLPFYFCLRAFSIQQARLSRSLEQASLGDKGLLSTPNIPQLADVVCRVVFLLLSLALAARLLKYRCFSSFFFCVLAKKGSYGPRRFWRRPWKLGNRGVTKATNSMA